MIGITLLAERYHSLVARQLDLEQQYDDDPTEITRGRIVAVERKLAACRRAIRMERRRVRTVRGMLTEV